MKMESHIQTSIELLDMFLATPMPFDVLMSKFFYERKWIGSSDRRAIAEFVYDVFRAFWSVRCYMNELENATARLHILIYLTKVKMLPINQLNKIFNGAKYAPQSLTANELEYLKQLDNKHEMPLWARCNFPEWMLPRLKDIFVDNIEQEMQALNSKAPLCLRINTLKADKKKVVSLLSNYSVKNSHYISDCISIDDVRLARNHEILKSGMAEIQDEGSQIIACLCDAKPGDNVVDFCAGAGGKTLALAASMQNQGRIIALDKHTKRLEHAKIRLRRAGVSNTFCNEITSKWIKRHKHWADIVLVDAPCSGTGVWRRNPDMRARFSEKDLEELTVLQAEILQRASSLVKPNGRLVYATCSVLREENETQVERFLANNPRFYRQNISLVGVDNTEFYRGEYLRLTPAQHNTDGFFAAVLIAKSE